MSAYNELAAVNVSGRVEKKNGLSFLSWAWAWAELKKRYPMSYYTIYESRDGWNYHSDGRTCWVKTGVTLVDGDSSLEHIEYLPVMDARNRSIPANAVTSFDVNKAIQRSLTKAVARHGLGLYIYAGEDLPEDEAVQAESVQPPAQPPRMTVIKGNTVPDAAQTRKQRMDKMCAELGIVSQADLLQKRRALLAAGLMEDKKISEMADEAFESMLDAFYKNFPREGAAI